MTPSFFLYTFGTFFSYMLAFYFVLPLRITGRQICWHVLATAVWANVVFLMVFSLDHGFMFILAGIIEVIYLIITLHLFAEGNFYENFIVFWGTFQISDGLARIIMESLVDADFVYAYMRADLNYDRVDRFILLYGMVLIVFFCIRPLVLYLRRVSEGYEGIYRFIFIVMMAFDGVDYALRIRSYLNGNMSNETGIRAFIGIVCLMLAVTLVLRLQRRAMKNAKRQMERSIARVGEQYEKMAAENKELQTLRHEINRYMCTAAEASDYVSASSMERYLQDMGVRAGHLLELSLSGNMRVDTLVSHYYEEWKKQGILLETILEPIAEEDEATLEYINIADEMFRFFEQGIRNKSWSRFSIRRRGNMWLFQMETGYTGGIEYCRRRLLDTIGMQMLVRRYFTETGHLLQKKNGSMLYQPDRDKITISVMYITGRYQKEQQMEGHYENRNMR